MYVLDDWVTVLANFFKRCQKLQDEANVHNAAGDGPTRIGDGNGHRTPWTPASDTMLAARCIPRRPQ
jgi:hypothetical protein